MPNWCENELSVAGDPERVKAFRETVKGEEPLDTNKLIPYPEHFRSLDEATHRWDEEHPVVDGKLPEGVTWADRPQDGFNQGGYEWCLENWGTKRGFCDVEVADEWEGRVEFTFSTAWSPPRPLIKKMGEMFPDLDFELRYYEGSMGFQGSLLSRKGQVVQDWRGEYTGSRGG